MLQPRSICTPQDPFAGITGSPWSQGWDEAQPLPYSAEIPALLELWMGFSKGLEQGLATIHPKDVQEHPLQRMRIGNTNPKHPREEVMRL